MQKIDLEGTTMRYAALFGVRHKLGKVELMYEKAAICLVC